jgi:hypothetical protein
VAAKQAQSTAVREGRITCGRIRRGLTIMVMMGVLKNETEGVDRKSVWRDKRDAAPLVGKNVKGNRSVVTWSVVS